MEEDRMCPYCLHGDSTEGRSYTGLHGTRADGAGAESAQRSHKTNDGGIRSKHYIGIYSSCAGCQRICSVTPRWTPGQKDRWLGGGSSYSSGVRLSRGKWNTLSLFFVLLLVLGAFEPCLCQIVTVSAPQVSYEINEGSASSLECNYTTASEHDEGAQDVSRPVLIIAWFKDGVEIARHQGTVRLTPSDVTEGVAIVRPATLFISKTTSSYAGKYTCRVSYGDAVASRNMTLSVLGNKPTIEGYEDLDSATFEGGATLRLTCKGFYPLMWSYPYNIDNERVSIRSTLVQIPDSSDWEETNNITIRNATYTDSGLFTCTHSHDGDLSGDGTSLSTEIYAFVTDLTVADNLFLPSDVTNMIIYYGDDLILPCRVTVPDANVMLIRADQTEVPPDELPPYDNRRGFLLNSSTASEFSGRVSCQASYRGLTAMRSFYIDIITGMRLVYLTMGGGQNEMTAAGMRLVLSDHGWWAEACSSDYSGGKNEMAAAWMRLVHLTMAGGQNEMTAVQWMRLVHLTMDGGQNEMTAAEMRLVHPTMDGGQNEKTAVQWRRLVYLTMTGGQNEMTAAEMRLVILAMPDGCSHMTTARGQIEMTAAGMRLVHLTMDSSQNEMTTAGMRPLHLTMATETPTLHVANRTMREGSPLSLTCTGGRPLIWKHSSSLSREAVIEVSALRAGDGSLNYRSTLTIKSAYYTDTGRFSCLFLQYFDKDDPLLEESVYIFVISEDSSHKFLPIDEPSLPYIEYDATSTFVVPCRVSDPHLQVNATVSYKDSQNEYKEFYKLWDLTYNPEIGFMVDPVNTRGKSVISLTFQCTLDIKEVLPLSFILQRRGEALVPLFLEVSESAVQYIAGRDELRLSCIGIIPSSVYQLENSQDFKPLFAWTSPGQRPSDDNPTGVGEPGFLRLPHNVTYTYELRRTATLADNGTFTCRAASKAMSISEQISVHILERGYARIQRIKEPGESERIVRVAGQTFCFYFQVSAYPQPKNFWLKAQGSPYVSNGRITLNDQAQDESGLNLTLCFQEVEMADEGTYSVITNNSYESNNVTFFLQVNVAPQVSVSIDPNPEEVFSEQFFLTMETYALTCKATGKPTPRSDWLYSNCYDGTTSTCNSEDDSSWSLVGDGSAMEMIEREGPVTTLRVVSSISKMYRCRATAPVPGLADAHQDVDFRVLDEPNGISVSMDPEKVYRTDNVTLTCEATKFLFDSISWLFVPYGGNASTHLQSSEDHSIETIENAPSVYSLSSMLTIHNVSDSDRGEYICRAASSEDVGRTAAVSKTVNVTEVEAASIIAHSNLIMVVDVDMDLIIMCSAQGKPTPDLALYRLEDGTRRRLDDAQVEPDGKEVTLTYKPEQTMLTMSGMYECVAKNRGGAESRNFSVRVLEGPDVSISIKPSNNVYEGDNVTITCRATKGTPTPQVWVEKVGSSTQRRGQPFNFSIDFPNVKADHEGTYRCLASNTIRNASVTEVLSVEVLPSRQSQIVQIGAIVTVCLLILLIIVIIICHCRRPKVRRASRLSSVQLRPRSMRFMSIYSTTGEDPYENLPYDPRWEFPRERLTLGSVIGKGAFGMVIKAVAVGIDGTEKNIIVAVKQVRAGASSMEKKALWAELKMLGHIGRHLNVVNFLGACTKDGPVLAIVEYCSRGNMLDFLRSKRKYFKESPEVTGSGSQTGHSSSTGASSFQSSTGSERRMKPVYSSVIVEEPNLQDDPIDVEDLLCYSFQVARGMEFLASKNVIHRDLAARNVLITDNYVVKICDFGLARHLYDDPDYVASGKQGRLPIKWMAPESIFDKVFTTYSDVWAYAVFLWEVFSLGGSPYPGFQMDESFYSKIKNGYRMNAPEHAPPGIYDTMLECWTPEPDARPSFSVLAVRLGDMLEANVRSEYIELNVPYEESNRKAASELPSPHEDTPLLRKPFQADVETSHHLGTPACCVTVPTIQEAEEIEERSTLSDDTELGIGIRRNGRTGSETAAEV
ncbi:vascular endothelial growth factor receptor 1-like [Diadema setosum]|uniref:vascular endothelial growth factor receptor 1-like n=1 Tax=Diadema setosum TaxID=31175 RepID=UPI003B3A5A96